jgi:hypothetical protein
MLVSGLGRCGLLGLRSQAENTGVKYKGIFDCGRSTYKTEGVRGLYKGMMPSMLAGVPYVGLQMTFYDQLKVCVRSPFHVLHPIHRRGFVSLTPADSRLPFGASCLQDNLGPHLPKREDGTPSVLAMLVCGSVAGLTAQTLTFPTDTVRHRMQANGVGGAVSMNWH